MKKDGMIRSDFHICSSLKASIASFGLFMFVLAGASAKDISWDLYNAGVQAYAAGDYATALERWQDLSLQKMPRTLQRPVWFQLGNVQFRIGEPLEQASPEEAAELWRRSCAAYRTALIIRPRDRDVGHNLELVQGRLANLMHRLGMDAFYSSQDKSVNEAIDLLRTSTEHLMEALRLAPDDSQITRDNAQAWEALRERLKERALTTETKGDDFARQENYWADQQAEEQFRAALNDLGEARRPSTPKSRQAFLERQPAPVDAAITQAEARVQQKLADLLTRMAQKEHKQGDLQAETDPDQALGHYESALDGYRGAQEVQPGNLEAEKGEREVREAMEKLYIREGRAALDRGKSALALQSTQAAPMLLSALSHFEAALRLNEKSSEARSGADEARRLLPEALTLAGQSELGAGDRSEPRSITEALSHYQEAEMDFRQSLELKPNQPSAEKGLREAEEKAARARQRAAQEAESIAKVSQPQNLPPRTLESLLGQIEEKERTPEFERERQTGQKNMRPRKYHADW